MHPIRTMLDATSGFECSMPEGLRIAGEIELPFSHHFLEQMRGNHINTSPLSSVHLHWHPRLPQRFRSASWTCDARANSLMWRAFQILLDYGKH